MPAVDVGHIVAALHIDAWLGDIRGGRVYWLLEHALVDSGLPGADVAGAALQARLKVAPKYISETNFNIVYFRLGGFY